MEWAFFVLIIIFLVGAVFCIGKYVGNSGSDNSTSTEDDFSIISDPRIREIVKELKEEAKSMTIFDFFKGVDFNSFPDGTFTESTRKNSKGVEVKEYSKQLDEKVMDLFDKLEIQIDGNKTHYSFSGYHSKAPIKELRNTANAFYFKYGANIDGKDIFNEKDENIIFKGYVWRSVWNMIKEEEKALSLTWYSNEKEARLTIKDFRGRN